MHTTHCIPFTYHVTLGHAKNAHIAGAQLSPATPINTIHNTRYHPVIFDGRKEHAVQHYDGERWSVVFFTAEGAIQAAPSQLWPIPTAADLNQVTELCLNRQGHNHFEVPHQCTKAALNTAYRNMARQADEFRSQQLSQHYQSLLKFHTK